MVCRGAKWIALYERPKRHNFTNMLPPTNSPLVFEVTHVKRLP